jgi:hypothetical protein
LYRANQLAFGKGSSTTSRIVAEVKYRGTASWLLVKVKHRDIRITSCSLEVMYRCIAKGFIVVEVRYRDIEIRGLLQGLNQ